MNAQQFGAFLRHQRTIRGIRQKQLAATLGVHATLISMIERGHITPTDERLWGLAAALGLDPFALHALAGRIPNGCVPQTYDKALAAAAAWRQVAKCGPRNPCQKAHTSLVFDQEEGQ